MEGRRGVCRDLLGRVEKTLSRTGLVLDVGCSVGIFLSVAKEAGWRTEGIELDPETAARTQRALGSTIHVGPALKVLPTLGRFDLIVMSHWLEHSSQPGLALQLAAAHLAPSGALLIRVPNADSLLARLTGASWSWFSPPNHLYYFDEGSLVALAGRHGLAEAWALTSRGDALFLPLELGIAFYRRITGRAVTEIRGGRGALAPTYLTRALERVFPANHGWLDRNDTELAILLKLSPKPSEESSADSGSGTGTLSAETVMTPRN